MALVLKDRVGGTAYSPSPFGTGSLTLSNSLTTYQSANEIGNNNTFYYLARHRTENFWEVGVGTVNTTGAFPVVARTTVLDGTSGPGVLNSFPAGYVDVISVFPATQLTDLLANVSLAASYAAAASVAAVEAGQFAASIAAYFTSINDIARKSEANVFTAQQRMPGLVVGTSVVPGTTGAKLFLEGGGLDLQAYGTSVDGATLSFYKSRAAAPGYVSAVAVQDDVGSIAFYGAANGTWVSAGWIEAEVEEVSASDIRAHLAFYTASAGALEQRFMLRPDGRVELGVGVTLANASGNLDINRFNGAIQASVGTFWRGDGVWAVPGGGGAVIGPVSSTSGRAAIFDGTTGTILAEGPAFARFGVSVAALTGLGGHLSPAVIPHSGVSVGTYGSSTQIPVVEVSIDGRVTSVGLVSVDVSALGAVTSVETSAASLLGVSFTGRGASIFLDRPAANAVYFTQTSAGTLQTQVNNVSAALTSINTALGTSIGTTNSAVTSVNTAITSVNAVTTSINAALASTQTALTSTNAATARLAAANTFTGANNFTAVTSVSVLRASGVFTANADAQMNAVTSVSVLRASGAVALNGATSVSTVSGGGTFAIRAGTWTPPVQLTDATSIAVNMALSNDFFVTLAGNRTIEAPTNLQPGQGGVIFIHQDSGGNRTLTWNSVWRFSASTAPTLTSAANSRDVVAYEVYTSTIIVAAAIANV